MRPRRRSSSAPRVRGRRSEPRRRPAPRPQGTDLPDLLRADAAQGRPLRAQLDAARRDLADAETALARDAMRGSTSGSRVSSAARASGGSRASSVGSARSKSRSRPSPRRAPGGRRRLARCRALPRRTTRSTGRSKATTGPTSSSEARPAEARGHAPHAVGDRARDRAVSAGSRARGRCDGEGGGRADAPARDARPMVGGSGGRRPRRAAPARDRP